MADLLRMVWTDARGRRSRVHLASDCGAARLRLEPLTCGRFMRFDVFPTTPLPSDFPCLICERAASGRTPKERP